MPTHLMRLVEARRVGQRPLGVGPFIASMPLPATRLLLSGISRDSTGTALPGCTCTLFKVTTDDLGRTVYTQMDQTVSDVVTGAYSFSVAQAAAYRVTWDLAGAPIRAGISLNSLAGDNFGS